MVVTLEQIPEEGLVLEEVFGPEKVAESLSQGRGTGFHAERGFPVKARFQKVSGGVLLTGEFTAELTSPCKRCVEDVAVSLPVKFTLNLIPGAHAKDEDLAGLEDDGGAERAGSFIYEHADEETFDGRTIDVDPLVREQLLLALPMNVLCQDGCKGLCPRCGQNLNERQCGCELVGLDPRLAGLKNLKL